MTISVPARSRLWLLPLAVATLLFSGPAGAGAGSAAPPGPCDIYAQNGTPCVAAYSSTRALFSRYAGPLYQVQRASDGATADVPVKGPGGYANAAAQDSFCANTRCTVTRLYDQSPERNDLAIEGPGGNGGQDTGVQAGAFPTTAAGHEVYGLYFAGGMGYRDNHTAGVPTGAQPQGAYMVADGTHVNANCCFDFGNAETNSDDNGAGHMDAVYFGAICWPFSIDCVGNGPWVAADLENGLFQSNVGGPLNPAAPGWPDPFVTAVVENDGSSTLTVKGGNAQAGALTTEYTGPLPWVDGYEYSPMQQEGAIVLGTGGDNSNGSIGTFFEGVMTAGVPSAAADNAVQANIVAAGYGR